MSRLSVRAITFEQVLVACERSRGTKCRSIEELERLTGESEATCLDALRRAQDRGLIDDGNPRWAYPKKDALERLKEF